MIKKTVLVSDISASFDEDEIYLTIEQDGSEITLHEADVSDFAHDLLVLIGEEGSDY